MVAIDPGTKNVGIAFPNRFFTLTKNGIGKAGLVDLARRTYEEVKNEHIIIIEDYAHGGMFNKEEAEFVGMLLLLLEPHHPNITMMPILSVKKCMTGDGSANKSKVMKAVREHYGIESKITHECDALAILYAYEKLDVSNWNYNL